MSARDMKIEGPPPETQNRPSSCDAGPVQSSFDAGQCAHSDTTPQHGAEANSQALTLNEYGRLDNVSRRIVRESYGRASLAAGFMPRGARQGCTRLGQSGSRVPD